MVTPNQRIKSSAISCVSDTMSSHTRDLIKPIPQTWADILVAVLLPMLPYCYCYCYCYNCAVFIHQALLRSAVNERDCFMKYV